MNGDFFSRLELELGSLAHEGMHLDDAGARGRRRAAVVRRGLALVALALVLAASLVSEFPATASGYAPAAVAAITRSA